MKKPTEMMIFAHGEWEIARQAFNTVRACLQWERRDGSFICFIGEEIAQQALPARPVLRADPPGHAEVYDAVYAAPGIGITEASIAAALGCARDHIRPALVALEERRMVHHVYRSRGCYWRATKGK